jgi:hypothetical protein
VALHSGLAPDFSARVYSFQHRSSADVQTFADCGIQNPTHGALHSGPPSMLGYFHDETCSEIASRQCAGCSRMSGLVQKHLRGRLVANSYQQADTISWKPSASIWTSLAGVESEMDSPTALVFICCNVAMFSIFIKLFLNLVCHMGCRYWLSVGAQPSDTVARLLGVAGVLPRLSRNAETRAHKEVLPPEHVGEPEKI